MKSRIKQLFFDCDNTLVKTEDVAFEACADLCNQILEEKGIEERYTSDQLLIEFVGLNFRRMISRLQQIYGFELTATELDFYAKAEEAAVVAKLEANAEPCEGAGEALQRICDWNPVRCAVVSSSADCRIRAALKKADLEKHFGYEDIYSAVNSLPKPTSKPDPAVYIHAMAKCGATPGDCIAVEDSLSGATAAVRAQIPCIAYVGCYHGERHKREVANILTAVGCKSVMYHWAEFENCLREVVAISGFS